MLSVPSCAVSDFVLGGVVKFVFCRYSLSCF